MMTKSFSTREKVLLVVFAVLLIFALYNLLVRNPSIETVNAATAELEDLEPLLLAEDVRAESIKKMQDALASVEQSAEASTITPLYDNFQNLLDELNQALATADNYKLNFVEPVFEDGLAKRKLKLIFYTNNYSSATKIVNKLYSGPYRCEITSFKFVPTENASSDLTTVPITATMDIVYYEIKK